MPGLSSFETVEGLGEHPVQILTMPVMESGRVVNMIQVGMSLESIDETRFRFLMIMAGVFPLGVVLAPSVVTEINFYYIPLMHLAVLRLMAHGPG